MEFSQPPPQVLAVPDITAPPPNFNLPPPPHNFRPNNFMGNAAHHSGAHHFQQGGFGKPGFKQYNNYNRGGHHGHGGGHGFQMTQDDFDGKRLRKSVMRKTVDYNASICKALEERLWQRDFRDRHALQPENIYIPDILPPPSYLDNPSNAITTRFVKTATNKMRCPIFTLAWTPEGRRLVTGASSGEFTLWNGLTFNFETILQAHDVPVRTMVWSHNDSWMVTGDHAGYVKYWQSNMNNVKMFQAHKEPIRGISFSPTDSKFVSCSDDGTLRVWDFYRCQEERVLRGHGADVKCVHWHPQKSLIVSGSKDNQQPIKLWDPKSGQSLATLHAHKSTVMDLKWNNNGNWLITSSRDHLIKLFDLRNLREEVQVFRGHKKEASAVSWHPVHEGLFCSGGSDGSILFWNVGTDKEIGCIETAHDSIVWTLAWHPLGHILCSGSNDHTIKFWTRNRPGDLMRDKYNLNTLPANLAMLDECEYDDAVIPGMGPEDKIEFTESLTADKGFIPGLDMDPNTIIDSKDSKKVPYSKPIPRNFQAQWNDTGRMDDDDNRDYKPSIENMQFSGDHIVADAPKVTGILVYGKFIPVKPGSELATVINQGTDALNKYISLGEIYELKDLLPKEDPADIQSPPVKKSRFEPIINHNAEIIYSETPHSEPVQQTRPKPQLTPNAPPPPPPTAHIPSLLGLKVPNPDEFCVSPNNSEPEFRPTPWSENENRPGPPWVGGPNPNLQNGFPFNEGGNSPFEDFRKNNGGGSGMENDFNRNNTAPVRSNGRNTRFNDLNDGGNGDSGFRRNMNNNNMNRNRNMRNMNNNNIRRH